MNGGTTILVVGETGGPLGAVISMLERRGHTPVAARTSKQALALAEERKLDAILVLLPLGNGSPDLLRRLGEAAPTTPLITAGCDDEIRPPDATLDIGVDAHVSNVLGDHARLLSTIGGLVGTRKDDVRLRYVPRPAAPLGWDAVVGDCAGMDRVKALVLQICGRISGGAAATVLITGETGTGKGLIAKCIHHNCARRSQPFVDVNCAAIPDSLIESELFGHERGAFTDAKTRTIGFFEAADHGTLFLDEIASVPIQVQPKLLTAIEDKHIRRIGGRQPISVDVQIIAGAQENLVSMVERRTFRADLYHRLNVITVRLPPLRERGEDKLRLAEAFIGTACREYGVTPRVLHDDAKKLIMSYTWPGNVRELKNHLERIVMLENDEVIRAAHFQLEAGRSSVRIENERGRVKVRLPSSGVSLEALEREIIRQAVAKCGGNISRAARYLSISRQTLIYRLKKHRLTDEATLSDAPPSSRGASTLTPPPSSRGPSTLPSPSSRPPSSWRSPSSLPSASSQSSPPQVHISTPRGRGVGNR